jgi:hypothetical protein
MLTTTIKYDNHTADDSIESKSCNPRELSQQAAIIHQSLLLFFLALQPNAGYGLLVSRGFLITQNDAPQSVGLLWTSDQPVTETSTWQHNTHNKNFRTHNRSRRAAVDLRFRPRGHWDGHKTLIIESLLDTITKDKYTHLGLNWLIFMYTT